MHIGEDADLPFRLKFFSCQSRCPAQKISANRAAVCNLNHSRLQNCFALYKISRFDYYQSTGNVTNLLLKNRYVLELVVWDPQSSCTEL